MVAMTVKMPGSEQVAKAFALMPRQMAKAVEQAMEDSGNAVKAKAQDNLSGPILGAVSGHLRASVSSKAPPKGMDTEATIGTSVGYGAVHQWGRRDGSLPALMWLTRSLEQVRDRILAIWNVRIKAALVLT